QTASTLFPYTTLFRSKVMKGDCQFLQVDQEWDQKARRKIDEAGLNAVVTLALPGKSGPLGVIAVGSLHHPSFHPDELAYLGVKRSEEHTSELQSRGQL